MKLLTSALMVVALTAASAKPIGWFQRHDADIRDKDLSLRWRQFSDSWSSESWESDETSSNEDSSESQESSESESSESESSESESSESESSEESSEEVFTDRTTPPVLPTTAMTTVTRGDGSAPTPEPGMTSTDGPIESEPTPTPGGVTECFTEEIPTVILVTDNRGDN